jgi:hypothetical protein
VSSRASLPGAWDGGTELSYLKRRFVPAVWVAVAGCVFAGIATPAVASRLAEEGDGAKQPAAAAAPKSGKARSARQRLDAAMEKADEAWRRAAIAAHREYVKGMEDALKAAGAAGNADDVALIAAALSEGKEELAELEKKKGRGARADGAGGGTAKSGRVLANKTWQPVLKVKKGQVLKITAKGEWVVSSGRGLRSGPDGAGEEFEGHPVGMLVARIGNRTFGVGAAAEIEVPSSGVLEMMCNDVEGHRDDNGGHLDVTIEVE